MTGGQAIRTARRYREMSQAELASLYGVCTRTVQRWEKDTVQLKWDTVKAVVEQVCDLKLGFVLLLEQQSNENN
ncbi:helix-turn-helix domain-containing protein [Pseudoalteromonas umbrosa]|uniref:helix-turn-helix domain-containing protein n=1 Tax=Pseudoalteromonas umbrosa TaxID=3048489 RepID=UPI0024C3C7A6|nr:helix-turn-helix transcriptional regulator [Pseudoalteromonas sp. B95]MDK1289799.1 helix-turn-helix transcriptional regulator [Pseudoalteromonas sp. B95]